MRLRCAVLLAPPPSPVPASLPLQKNSPPPTPSESTLTPSPRSADSKSLTAPPNPLESTLTKKRPGGCLFHPSSFATRYSAPLSDSFRLSKLPPRTYTTPATPLRPCTYNRFPVHPPACISPPPICFVCQRPNARPQSLHALRDSFHHQWAWGAPTPFLKFYFQVRRRRQSVAADRVSGAHDPLLTTHYLEK